MRIRTDMSKTEPFRPGKSVPGRGIMPPGRRPRRPKVSPRAEGRGSGVTNMKQDMADRISIAKKYSGGIGVAPKGSPAALAIARDKALKEGKGKAPPRRTTFRGQLSKKSTTHER